MWHLGLMCRRPSVPSHHPHRAASSFRSASLVVLFFGIGGNSVPPSSVEWCLLQFRIWKSASYYIRRWPKTLIFTTSSLSHFEITKHFASLSTWRQPKFLLEVFWEFENVSLGVGAGGGREKVFSKTDRHADRGNETTLKSIRNLEIHEWLVCQNCICSKGRPKYKSLINW